MDALKKVALHLHGLASQDQAWLLQQLPEQQRSALTALLIELQELGIPAELGQAERGDASNRLPAPAWLDAAAPADEIDELSAAAPAAIIAALGNELNGVIVAVLQVHAWPWRAPLLESFDPLRRAAIIGELQGQPPRLAEHTRQVLLQGLAARVRDLPGTVDVPAVAAPRRRQPLRRWLWRR